jgi:HAE1 family hydrophobic/amphiphilic exporter-1
MVIDSGTVVLENIQNHLDAGLSRQKAAIQGTSEVAAAVFASVLTGMAVFFPIVFVEGVAGQIFGDLALTVVFSLLCSMVVALLFIPMLGARELTLSEPPARARDIPAGLKGLVWKAPRRILAFPLAIGRFALRFLLGLASLVVTVASAWAARLSLGVLLRGLRLFNRATLWMADRFLAGYGVAEARFARVLAWSLERPGAVALGAFSSLILAAVLFSRVGVELIPEVHQGRFTAEIALPAGTPLARTDAVCRQIEDRIRRIDGVETVYSVVGAERRADRKADEGENTARILITLEGGEDLAAREAEAMAKVQRALEGWPGLSSRFTRPALFSFHTPVEVVLYGNELPALKAASNAAVAAMQDVGGLVDVRSSMAGGHPEVQVRYDRARLDALGLGVGQVATAVRDGVQGVTATRLAHGERRVDLLVRLAEVDRDSLEALAAVNVNPRLVPPIRLDSVAELVEGEGPAEIRRVDQRRAAVVSASLTGFDLGGAGEQVARALQHAELGDAEFELAGQSREMSASLESLGWALILAIFLVYVIMASTFESVRDPFVILFSVPLSLVGVAVGLWLTGTPVSVVVFIGLIVLAGVVVANAIVLVDCINLLLRQGRDLDTAIREAAATRLRPILITALNSVIGLVPLALGYGEGAEIQRPLAVTIIFGLGSSTFLTLVVVPVVYRIVNRGRLRATG